MNQNALVVLSGGQDSATCLVWAHKNFKEVSAISFNYGQRHSIELECAAKLCEMTGTKTHNIINVIDLFKQITDSKLMNTVDDISAECKYNKNLPASFVPLRNQLFLSFAFSVAYINNIGNIVTGVCQTDYSGYPDCRDTFIKSLNVTSNLALDSNIQIHTPLMWINKAETIKLMESMNSLNLYKYTHTCYNGNVPPCGECPSCKLRNNGFKEAGIIDPLLT